MAIQFGGLASGLDTNSIITQLIAIERKPIDALNEQKSKIQLQQGLYSNVKARTTDLIKSVQGLTVKNSLLATDPDLFNAKKGTSADDTKVKVTVTNNAASQTMNLDVIALATQTRANTVGGVAQLATAATNLSDLALGTISAGTFTIFYNGIAHQITVDPTVDTLNDVFTDISAAVPAITPQVTGGKIQLIYPDGNNVQLGAGNDTSNFLTATQLLTGPFTDLGDPTSQRESANALTSLNQNAVITTATANLQTAVTAGTFLINGKSFDTTGKTFGQLITEINNSGAKVTASYDLNANKLQFISTDPGSTLMSLADGTGNFLTAMGLIVAGDTTAAQTAGTNAQFSINGGPPQFSASNTISESITGLTGVTLELKKADPGVPVSITIGRDIEQLTTAISDLVTKLNAALTYIDQQTKSSEKEADRGGLAGETSLTRFRSQLRAMFTTEATGLSGMEFSSLPMAGLSTGAVTGTASTSGATPTFAFDKAKFEAALAKNFDQVRGLFIGKTATEGYDGILTQVESLIQGALSTQAVDGNDGLFAAVSTSQQNRIESLNKAIERGEDRLATKETMLRKQFTQMESLIAQYQSQGSAITGLQNQITANQKAS